jgi:hypothetical protein
MAYPAQLLYLPAAVNGIYTINEWPQPTLAVPTQGNPYQFTINADSTEMDIPLAVYRSGIDAKGAVSVGITTNSDTIAQLISNSTITAQPLPASKYSLVSSVNIADGQDTAPFDLVIDLNFLKNNIPQEYALAISISSQDRDCNPQYSTVIIIIDTSIFNTSQ